MAIRFTRQQVVHHWLQCQGLSQVEQFRKLTKRSFVKHLESTGGLQVDSVNAVDRAHYLTLWSRFGKYDRAKLDGWIYRDRLAFEYWGHEASILPISHLPLSLRRMKRFPPDRWANASYWKDYQTSETSKRRVMKLIREQGPLESADFDKTTADHDNNKILGWGSVISKEDKRSLGLLWHAGKLAIRDRKHFRKFFDLAKNVYPADVEAASLADYQDNWLLCGLAGSGIASLKHLDNYVTAPNLTAKERDSVLRRNLKNGRVREVEVEGFKQPFYGLESQLDMVSKAPEPTGTTLVCPFDSLLWQRKRAEELLEFHYRVEIYVPESKRKYGYYVMPILHNGAFVGRLDPKLHRDKAKLEIKSVYLEPGFKATRDFRRELASKVEELASFLDANEVESTEEVLQL